MLTIVNVIPSDDLQSKINACPNPSIYNQYDLILSAGTYNVMSLLTRDYVNIKGATTDRTLYKIKGEKPNNTTDPFNYSTIDYRTTTILQNLTITCKNMRYPYHNDGCPNNTIQTIINCHVEHLGNWLLDGITPSAYWTSCHANGCGTSSGMVLKILNSHYIARQLGSPLYAHNNVSFTTPSHIIADNCIFEQADGQCSIFLDGGLGIGNDLCTLTNNTLIGGFWANKWLSEGYGNTYDFMFTTSDNVNFEYKGEEHVKYLSNYSGFDIPEGTPCVYDGFTDRVRAMAFDDSLYDFAGIAMHYLTNNTQGYMYFSGQLLSYKLNLPPDLVVGDTLGIDPSNRGILVKNPAKYILTYTKDWTFGVWATYKVFTITPVGSSTQALTPKVDGTWKVNALTFIKSGGSWKQVEKVQVKQDGSWKS